MRPSVVFGLLCACSGEILSPPPSAVPQAPLNALAPLPRRISLLTDAELTASVRSLTHLQQLPALPVSATTVRGLLGPDWVDVTSATAYAYSDFAQHVVAAWRSAEPSLFTCRSDEHDCARKAVIVVATRAFRRPLEAGELDDLLEVYSSERDEGGSHADAIAATLETVLQAPSFLYRTELGTPLTAWERAAFVSYFLTGTLPDDALRSATAAGALDDPDALARQIDRLLDTAEARAHQQELLMRWLRTDDVLALEKSSSDFSPQVAQSMREQTARDLADNLSGAATLESLLTAPRTNVDAVVAGIDGMSFTQPGWLPMDVPERTGILTEASLLARLAGVSDSSVVRRGLFVARDLLCLDFAPPPPGVVQASATVLAALPDERARAAYRAGTAPCSSCHPRFDPYGLLFERYDALGRYRETMNGAPIDASWTFSDGPTPGLVDGTPDFAARLAQSPDVFACTARRFVENALGHALDAPERADAITEGFVSTGGSWRRLFRDTALWGASPR